MKGPCQSPVARAASSGPHGGGGRKERHSKPYCRQTSLLARAPPCPRGCAAIAPEMRWALFQHKSPVFASPAARSRRGCGRNLLQRQMDFRAHRPCALTRNLRARPPYATAAPPAHAVATSKPKGVTLEAFPRATARPQPWRARTCRLGHRGRFVDEGSEGPIRPHAVSATAGERMGRWGC